MPYELCYNDTKEYESLFLFETPVKETNNGVMGQTIDFMNSEVGCSPQQVEPYLQPEFKDLLHMSEGKNSQVANKADNSPNHPELANNFACQVDLPSNNHAEMSCELVSQHEINQLTIMASTHN